MTFTRILLSCFFSYLSTCNSLTLNTAFNKVKNASDEYFRHHLWKEGLHLHQHKVLSETFTVFNNQDLINNISCFRIPSLIMTRKHTLVAFSEARLHSCQDCTDKGIVSKRSTDFGKTWSNMVIYGNVW